MKVLIVFGALIAYATCQFGGFGGFGGLPHPHVPDVGSHIPDVGSHVPDVGSHIGDIAGHAQDFASNIPGVQHLTDLPGVSNVKDFGDFAAQTGKHYADEATKVARQALFEARKQTVDNNNKLFELGQSSFQLAVNFFADLPAELLARLSGRKRDAHGDQVSAKNKIDAGPATVTALPDCFDWREQGGVTPVKFQGLDCGACWSFSVTGAIEGHYFRKTGQLVNLSEQQLVDCAGDYDNTGCDGGFQEYGFAYVADNKGIDKAEGYPYVEMTDTCKYKPELKAVEIMGFASIEPGDEQKMKEIIATLGPLACSVNASPDSFVLYKAGIYKDMECNAEEVNHAILVVGYGTDPKDGDYWIIKNSWTDKWGESGYMKLPRNAKSFCGIANECSYPLI